MSRVVRARGIFGITQVYVDYLGEVIMIIFILTHSVTNHRVGGSVVQTCMKILQVL